MIRISAAAGLALWASISLAVAPPAPAEEASDVIARVGDQTITFREINTALNSSAIVGVSVPALGTPERDTVRITLLDRFVSANLLYLDARKQGVDQDPRYRRELDRFEYAMLAGLYRQNVLMGDLPVSEEEVQALWKERGAAGAELTADVRASLESMLRKDKLKARLAEARTQVRDGVKVVVHAESLAPAGDAERAASTPVAEMDGTPLTWGEVKGEVVAAGKGAVIADPLAIEADARRRALENEIDLRIMARKARQAGLDKDPVYQARVREYRKTHLINLHRDRLIAGMEPTDEQLKAYYEGNRASILLPETRKVQMVVVKTKEEADAIKARIESKEITMYVAARDYSIAAKAKEDLGEVGWVNQGTTVPALDQVIFSAGPGEVAGPVETPAGWHLVLVQDVQEAKYDSFDDQATRKLVRRKYLEGKLDAYTVNLRKNEFPVEVYQDVLVRLAQQEADMVRDLAAKAQEPGSVTQQRLEEMKKLMQTPAPKP